MYKIRIVSKGNIDDITHNIDSLLETIISLIKLLLLHSESSLSCFPQFSEL